MKEYIFNMFNAHQLLSKNTRFPKTTKLYDHLVKNLKSNGLPFVTN